MWNEGCAWVCSDCDLPDSSSSNWFFNHHQRTFESCIFLNTAIYLKINHHFLNIFCNVYNVLAFLFSIVLFFLPRLYLAALHFNENTDRPQATTSAGEPLFRLHFQSGRKEENTQQSQWRSNQPFVSFKPFYWNHTEKWNRH